MLYIIIFTVFKMSKVEVTYTRPAGDLRFKSCMSHLRTYDFKYHVMLPFKSDFTGHFILYMSIHR